MNRQVVRWIAISCRGECRLEHTYEDVGVGRAHRTTDVGARPAGGGDRESLPLVGSGRPVQLPTAPMPEHWIAPFDKAPPVAYAVLDEQGIALRVIETGDVRSLARARTIATREAHRFLDRGHDLVDVVGLGRGGKVITSHRYLSGFDDDAVAA